MRRKKWQSRSLRKLHSIFTNDSRISKSWNKTSNRTLMKIPPLPCKWLQKYQNRAARVISGAGYETRSTDVLESLGWETLEKRRLRNNAVLMYKILNDHSAPILKQLFNKRNEAQISYNLRNNQTDITLPNPKTEYCPFATFSKASN